MQVNCKINVVNRLLPSTGQTGPSRLVWSSITLTENPKSGVVELSLATSRNKAGAKYRVTGNVEQVFAKFVSEGKLTIRFKQPPHDLCLSGEPRHMERVLSVTRGQDDKLKKGTLCPLLTNNSAAKVVVPKTKLNISSRADYPVTTRFPDTLTTLKISGIALKKFDRRILNIKGLEVLDLSNNEIAMLPEHISPLTKLRQLNLSHNEIKFVSKSFLNSARVANLDLSHNQISGIPNCISRLTGLQTLKLDHNSLRKLPPTISKLRNLRVLTVSSNKITTLPVSFHALKLDHIDTFGNPFDRERTVTLDPSGLVHRVPTLVAIAAKATITFKLKYGEEDLPSTLITYLHESSTFCPCGRLLVEDGLPSNGSLNLLRISDSVCGDKVLPIELTLCSALCYHRFSMKVIS